MAETVLDFAGLLGLLGFTAGEFVSVGYEVVGKAPWHTAVMAPADAPAYVAGLFTEADVYFGVCPTEGPARDGGGRGGERDITRLSSLWADLDACQGKCGSFDVIDRIIGDLTAVLGTRPSAVTNSGNGRHPFWPLADGQVVGGDVGPALALVRRWERLVTKVAKSHGAQVDSVYDLARMLRVPNTFNNKPVA